jgi:hypothetical protein
MARFGLELAFSDAAATKGTDAVGGKGSAAAAPGPTPNGVCRGV